MKWLRECCAVTELIVLFLLLWAVIFGILLALGALSRLAGSGSP